MKDTGPDKTKQNKQVNGDEAMTALKQRARAHENKFAHDQDFMFRARARRNTLLGLWAAAVLHDKDPQAYARTVAAADIDDADGAFARLRRDFDAAGIAVLDDELRGHMSNMLRDVANEMYDYA